MLSEDKMPAISQSVKLCHQNIFTTAIENLQLRSNIPISTSRASITNGI